MIKFHSISLANFQSYGDNLTTFILDKSPTTLVSGPNGNGKSSILNAIVFCLFGKTLKGVNKNSLINTINQRDLRTVCEFSKGDLRYKVVRTIKPTTFTIEVNGVKMEEEAGVRDQQKVLEDILGFDHSSFVKTCVLSTENYIPFLQLTTFDRRNFIESLLGISVFSAMNKQLKTLVSANKDTIQTYKTDLELKKAIYDEKMKRMNKDAAFAEEKRAAIKEKLISLKSDWDQEEFKLEGLCLNLETLNTELSNWSGEVLERSQHEILSKIANTRSDIATATKQSAIYSSGHCHECNTKFTGEHQESQMFSILEKKTKAEEELEIHTNELNRIKKMIAAFQAINSDIKDVNLNIKLTEASIGRIKRAILEKKAELDSVSDIVEDDLQNEINELTTDIKICAAKYRDELTVKDIYRVVAELLKDDGVKANIIRQYIPVLNALVNQNLEILNSNHRISLNEQFEDTLTSRFSNELRYDNLSMGEKQRIDISLLMALRKVGALKNSVHCNLLFLDEVADASMDSSGTDDLMILLEEISKDTHVFIVSHKTNLSDKVRSVINLEKVGGFTKIAS